MKSSTTIEPFPIDNAEDREAHEVVTSYSDRFGRRLSAKERKSDIPGEARLLEKDPDWNRRCVLAIFEQAAHLAKEEDRINAIDIEEDAEEQLPEDQQHWAIAATVFRRHAVLQEMGDRLLRRKLPLTEDCFVDLLRWQRVQAKHRVYFAPGGLALQLEKWVKSNTPSPELTEQIRLAANFARENGYSDGVKFAKRLEAVLATATAGETGDTVPNIASNISNPAPAGDPHVLVALKQHLGMLPTDEVATEEIGPDEFALRVDSPLREEHERFSQYLRSFVDAELAEQAGRSTAYTDYQEALRGFTSRDGAELARIGKAREAQMRVVENTAKAAKADASKTLLEPLDDAAKLKLLLAVMEREAAQALDRRNYGDEAPNGYWSTPRGINDMRHRLHPSAPSHDRNVDVDRMLFLSACTTSYEAVHPWVIDLASQHLASDTPTDGERFVLNRLRCYMINTPALGILAEVPQKLTDLIDGPGHTLLLVPGEHWADAVHVDVGAMKDGPRGKWIELIKSAGTATGGKPSSKWSKAAKPAISAVKAPAFRTSIYAWFVEAKKGRSVQTLGGYAGDRSAAGTFNDGNADVLKGLVWMLAAMPDNETPRRLAELLLTCIKKVPGVGPRCVKVANACVWALGELAAGKDDDIRDAALGQLARLKAKVSFKTTLKMIEKALDKAADAAGMSKADLEELGVPDFGFEDGVLRETFGDASVELRVEGNKIVTAWTNEKGKAVKSPPAAVKKNFADDVKELKQIAKDAEGVLSAVRDRLDGLYLLQKSWPMADWRERYLDHGLIGTLVKRLIWNIDGNPTLVTDNLPADGTVTLWHPIESSTAQVLALREQLEAARITQPFKQAHREVYLLTDAERNTATYSNRFAAHVIRQHQFNALANGRGWDNQLRLMVDDEYAPPSRALPAFGLRAEFWVEGIGDNYGSDTTESGSYLRLATDQVRFYNSAAAINSQHASGGGYVMRAGDVAVNHPLPLEQIPPIVFSEILRDCDLFVGVGSVGNDPTWQDGGPEGRFRDYWQSYSFGDLTNTARTRKAVLEKLVPRLKIRDVARIDDKWLCVKGTVREYKIHLGSGNILMEPNDQYLCIVPDGKSNSDKADTGTDFLPFEGDRTLSIIISKAFLLAADDKIKDPTILSQIGR